MLWRWRDSRNSQRGPCASDTSTRLTKQNFKSLNEVSAHTVICAQASRANAREIRLVENHILTKTGLTYRKQSPVWKRQLVIRKGTSAILSLLCFGETFCFVFLVILRIHWYSFHRRHICILFYRCVDTRDYKLAELCKCHTDDERCTWTMFNPSQACQVLKDSPFNDIYFVGDSFIRNMSLSFLITVSVDKERGSWEKTCRRFRKNIASGKPFCFLTSAEPSSKTWTTHYTRKIFAVELLVISMQASFFTRISSVRQCLLSWWKACPGKRGLSFC